MIYLIRHTTPAVARGMCYGQTDLDVTASFHEEAGLIRRHLPGDIASVYSSPLRRCTLLADELYPGRPLRLMGELMEIHCGEWEMRAWDELPPEDVNPWMADFVRVRIPGGESYLDLHERVTRCWDAIRLDQAAGDIAVIAHGGVLRSILSGINGTPLIDSFKAYSLHYGCVVRLFESGGRWQYEVLWNQAPAEKEQHKPKAFYQ
ncbi:MAG TPA: alpha-ribazole phosphatase family protein [Puia sp.]|jgi:alpha-ribazole phosphatase|nr:alpha-ribazole phosphatase family protein [Puia sp.]